MNQKGFSLIEVLVSVFLVAIISLIAGQSIVGQKKNHKQIAYLEARRELTEEIESEFSSFRLCSEVLRQSLTGQNILPPGFSGQVAAPFFDERYYHPLLKIEEVILNFQLAPQGDGKQEGNLKTYTGFFEFKAVPRVEDLKESMLEMKKVKVPLTVLDKSGTGRWSEVLCTHSLTQTNSLISEACSYYGGTLVDGTHCDFNRYMRRHQPAGASAVPVIPTSDGSIVDGKPRVSHMALPDVMCYLDTLITMIPDVQYQNRDPSLDRYISPRTTLFCKRPGLVKAAPNVDINVVLRTMSSDVREYFREIQNEQ